MTIRKSKIGLRVDEVRITWELESDAPERWSVQAVATVSYALADGCRRLFTLPSAGLSDIELGGRPSADAMYRSKCEDEQIDDLRLHLTALGIDIDAGPIDWAEHRRRAFANAQRFNSARR